MEFRILGPLEVWAAGKWMDVGQPRQRTVLAVLLVDVGRLVTMDALVDRVWGEQPPAGARRALHAHVARVRGALTLAAATAGEDPVPVLRRSGGYLLDADPDLVDLHRFRRLVDQAREAGCPVAGRVALLRDALGLWLGEPLSGLPGEWAARIRRTLRQQHVNAAIAWAHAERAAGNAAASLTTLADLLGENPLDESLAAALMLAQHDAGHTAEALACYAAVRRRLSEELGTDPGAHLQEVHQAILRGDVARPEPTARSDADARSEPGAGPAAAPAEAGPAQLPGDIPAFTGRGEYLRALDELLDSAGDAGTVVISAIAGTAGVGKTDTGL